MHIRKVLYFMKDIEEIARWGKSHICPSRITMRSAGGNKMASAIRNTGKALIVSGGKVLVVKMEENGRVYYVLPGGGQREGESLYDTVCRAVIEELGMIIVPEDLVFVYEGVHGERYHRVDFVFLCRYIGDAECCGGELIETAWLDSDTLTRQPFYPSKLRKEIRGLLYRAIHRTYLGSKDASDAIYID